MSFPSGLLDALAGGVLVIANTGRFRDANAEAARLLDCDSVAELLSLDIASGWDVVDEAGRPIAVGAWPVTRVLSGREARATSLLGLARRGRPRRWLEVSCAPLGPALPSPPFDAVVASLRDVTEAVEGRLALEESELRFTELVENIDGIVWEADPVTFAFRYVSPVAERLLGYPVERWLHEPGFWAAHIHPDDRQRATAFCMTATARGESHDFEYRMLAADGRYVWLHDLATVRAEGGRPVSLRGLMVDITARKQVAERLEMLSLVARETTNGVVITDAAGRVTWANAAFERTTGFSLAELTGRTPGSLLQGAETSTQTVERMRAALAARQPFTEQLLNYRKDGTPYWIHIACNPLLDASGAFAGFVAIEVDITDQRRAAEALETRQRLLERMGAVAHVGAWELELATGLVLWSEEARRIHEAPPGFQNTLDVGLRFYPPEGRAVLEEAIGRAIADGVPFDLELPFITWAGRHRWVRAAGEAQRVDGRVTRLYGAIQDITERRVAELERERLETRLREADKLESIGRLAGGIAHDFNNMLSVILGYTNLLLDDGPADATTAARLAAIRAAAERSAEVTRQLLGFSRQQPVQPRVLDLNESVGSLLAVLRRLIGEDIRLTWQPGAALTPVRIDPAQVTQILTNLAVNARDAIATTGDVIVSTASVLLDEAFCRDRDGLAPGPAVRLSVRDSGRGMTPEVLARIFEPFFTTKAIGAGTGLGLSTVYGIVRQNGGWVDVESAPGAGTTFHLYLPRSPEAAAPEEERAPTTPTGHAETVLLVEDEPALAMLGARLLESLGYRVRVATSPADALELGARGEPVDLLLTDVVMTGMNGRELAERLGACHPGLPCLYMSGYSADIVAQRGELADGTVLLQKPFTRQELARRVREALDGRARATA
ncbi:MAG: PAS domain S-box protein [Gemmatimonadales bacterium]|nr:PAS domain S-box protein [Gemmatimonadales bacterium]